MATQSLAERKNFLLLERHAEHAALAVVRGENFTQCLKMRKYPLEIQVPNKKGDMVSIHGRDVYNNKTWEKFLADAQPDEDLCILTGVANDIATRYAVWIRTKHTERYTYIKGDDEVRWLKNVTLLAVIRHIMENKHESSNFADEGVASEMSDILLLHEFARDLARAVNHGMKKQERAMELIEGACEKFCSLVEARKKKIGEPLPALPAGTPPPLLLDTPEEESYARNE